jgi:hypothetical protein
MSKNIILVLMYHHHKLSDDSGVSTGWDLSFFHDSSQSLMVWQRKKTITVSKAPETIWMEVRKFLVPIVNGILAVKPAIIKLRYSRSFR